MGDDQKKLTVFFAPLRIRGPCRGFWEGEGVSDDGKLLWTGWES